MEKQGHIDLYYGLYYGDESGFCLTSALPYAWQFPGEQVAPLPRHRLLFNVLGFYNATTNDLHAAAREGSIDAAYVIDTLDAWAATRTRPTVLVLDNARIHHSAAFQARLQHWEDQDIHISTCPLTAPTSTKLRPCGVKSTTSGFAPKPTAILRPSRPPFGIFSTAWA